MNPRPRFLFKSTTLLAALGAAATLLFHGTDTVRAGEQRARRYYRQPPPLDESTRAELGRLTLDKAIALAVRRNPDVLHQLEEIQRLQGVYIEVRAAALPRLVASGSFSQEDRGLLGRSSNNNSSGIINTTTGTTTTTTTTTTPATGAASSTQPATRQEVTATDAAGTTTTTTTTTTSIAAATNSTSTSVPNKSYQVELQLSQTVFNYSIPFQIRAAQLTEGNAYYQLRETVDQVILNVRTGFYQVLLDEALIAVQEESVRLLESQLQDQQNRFAAGTVPRFNVLQAQVALSNQRPQLITAENNFQLAKLQLARLIGVDSEPIGGRIADFKVIGKLVYEPRSFNVGQALSAALANRAILKLNRQSVYIQSANVESARSGYLPTITASAGLLQRNSGELDNYINGWFIGAQGTWNIFDGLATYGRMRQARAARNEALTTYDDGVRQVTLDVQNVYQNIQQAKQLVASQVLNVQEAEEAVRLAQARLAAGAGTQLDVLNAQVQLTTAESTELNARFQYAVAVAGYERVTGTSTVYQNNFTDPLTRAKAAAPVATVVTPTRTVNQGETPAVATKRQSSAQRAEGSTNKPKIDAERAGRLPPPTTHPLDPVHRALYSE